MHTRRAVKIRGEGTVRQLRVSPTGGCRPLSVFNDIWGVGTPNCRCRIYVLLRLVPLNQWIPRDFPCYLEHGDPVGISQRSLVLGKQDWLGYHVLKKAWWYVKPFRYTIPERDRCTDKRTELLHNYRASALLWWRAIKAKKWIKVKVKLARTESQRSKGFADIVLLLLLLLRCGLCCLSITWRGATRNILLTWMSNRYKNRFVGLDKLSKWFLSSQCGLNGWRDKPSPSSACRTLASLAEQHYSCSRPAASTALIDVE